VLKTLWNIGSAGFTIYTIASKLKTAKEIADKVQTDSAITQNLSNTVTGDLKSLATNMDEASLDKMIADTKTQLSQLQIGI